MAILTMEGEKNVSGLERMNKGKLPARGRQFHVEEEITPVKDVTNGAQLRKIDKAILVRRKWRRESALNQGKGVFRTEKKGTGRERHRHSARVSEWKTGFQTARQFSWPPRWKAGRRIDNREERSRKILESQRRVGNEQNSF